MNDEELITQLKSKKLPSFGTRAEKIERLKKYYQLSDLSDKRIKSTVQRVQEIEKNREERRKKMQKRREDKKNKEMANELKGKKGDVDFESMIQNKKFDCHKLTEHIRSDQMKVCVCVRKRPIFKPELAAGENDVVSVANPEIRLFTQKLKVDGISKYLDVQNFKFDNSFNENQETHELFDAAVDPVIEEIFNGGNITLFAQR